jgi:hypothetical protein
MEDIYEKMMQTLKEDEKIIKALNDDEDINYNKKNSHDTTNTNIDYSPND